MSANRLLKSTVYSYIDFILNGDHMLFRSADKDELQSTED